MEIVPKIKDQSYKDAEFPKITLDLIWIFFINPIT